MEPKIHIIIVAAGTGNRFGSNIPKQFVPLDGRPVLMRAIDAFSRIEYEKDILLVLNKSDHKLWKELCDEYKFESPDIVFGGASRTDSVRNALNHISKNTVGDNDIVLIHDGARPLVDTPTIHAVISGLAKEGATAVIPCTRITDSLMTADYNDSTSVDRSSLVSVQTPQGFSAKVLISAYEKLQDDEKLSDDASVVCRYAGAKIHLVDGAINNIKITYPLDIKIAELYLKYNT